MGVSVSIWGKRLRMGGLKHRVAGVAACPEVRGEDASMGMGLN